MEQKDDSSSYDVGTVGESSFLSEFTPSDFDAFDLDQNEVDPISEADVYLAYGRYQQAEDLMRQAIEDQPDRDECKLKLLEIFYANENKTEFEAYVKELIQQGKNKNAAFWSKVTEMGRELDANSSLFNVENQSVQQSVFDLSQQPRQSQMALQLFHPKISLPFLYSLLFDSLFPAKLIAKMRFLSKLLGVRRVNVG